MADLKPIYKRVNGEWKKQTAFQKQNGEWVKISNAEDTPEQQLSAPTLSYADGVLTITDYSKMSTNYTLKIYNSSSGSYHGHGGGSN